MNILEVGIHGGIMASSLDVGNLLWAIGILALPVILALPAKLLYQTVILGVGPAEREITGLQFRKFLIQNASEHFREVLDEESRIGTQSWQSKTKRNRHALSSDNYPLLLVPMIFILPVVAIATLPIIILGIPVLYLLEVLLIRRKLIQCNQIA